MFKAMSQLSTKREVLPPFIAALISGLAVWLGFAMTENPRHHGLLMFLAAAIFIGTSVFNSMKVYNRYTRLKNGRCAHPPCKGVVKRPDDHAAGVVVCPTCKHRWPAIAGIKFKLTSRTHG